MENNFKKIADECLGKQEKFEEEFEDELYLTVEGIILRKKSIAHLIRNYNLYGKIKIKARKGKIVIERIEE